MIVNPLPMQTGLLGAAAGAAMGGGAENPVHSIINAGVGFLVGAVGGGIAARRDAKIARQENPELRNKTQLGKYGDFEKHYSEAPKPNYYN